MPIAIGRKSSRGPAQARVKASPRGASCDSTRSGSNDSSGCSSNTSSFSSNTSGCSARSHIVEERSQRHYELPRLRKEEGRSSLGTPSFGAGDSSEMSGRFTAEIIEDAYAGHGSSYTVKITGINGDHFVRRRYTCFAEMSEIMGPRREWLPHMPPKSFFRRRFSPKFRAERARALGRILAFVLAGDPLASDPLLRSFLGLPKDEPGAGRPRVFSSNAEVENKSQALSLTFFSKVQPRVLSLIYEVENESRGSSYQSSPTHPFLLAALIQSIEASPDSVVKASSWLAY